MQTNQAEGREQNSAQTARRPVGSSTMSRDRLLALAGVGVWFCKGQGDELTWEDETGTQRKALDLVGGAGALLLGHNHPAIVEAALAHFSEGRPVLVQGARRAPAERLKQMLAQRLERETGRHYTVTLLSTGTEAVEAALKHARLELLQRQRELENTVTSNLRQLRRRLGDGTWQVTPEWLRDCARGLGVPRLGNFDELCQVVSERNARALQHPGILLALEGGFHGKTLGSLAVTWNLDARLPFVRGEPLVRFVTAGDSLDAIARETAEPVFEIQLEPPRVARRSFQSLVAFVAEPIRGEGGVFELEDALVDELRAFRKAHPEVPIIADEIQCGLGRTGHFIESGARGLDCPYLVFGKALGGGVAKLSAVAIETERYVPEFSLLHTSTFGDDEYSAALGIAFLETAERERVQERAAELGARIKNALEALQAAWPGQLAAVRGRGLMLGVELHEQQGNPSAVIRALDADQLLNVVVAGHLLHRWGIRILPTFGRRRVLRIQPSAFLDPEHVQRIVQALAEVCEILAAGDAYALLRYLVQHDASREPLRIAEPPAPSSAVSSAGPLRSRVAFIGHLVESKHLASWDDSLARFSQPELAKLVDLLQGLLPPRVITTRRQRSSTGANAELSLIGIAMTAAQIEHDLRHERGANIRAQVFAAYELARDLGCSLVGFGGYTSVATTNCVELVEHGPAVTTGNALTVGLAYEAMLAAMQDLELSLGSAHAAICGATGNIGQVYASLLAGAAGSLLLVGRAGSLRRLRSVAREVAKELAVQANERRRGGDLFEKFSRAYSRLGAPPVDASDLLERIEAALGEPLLTISDDLSLLVRADVVFSASNSAVPILEPHHIAQNRRVLVCDVAVPADVSPRVEQERPLALVIRGGVAMVPNDPHFSLPGFPLNPGETYACAAETLLLGLAGVSRDFSRGMITTAQVREVLGLARLHGFQLASYKRNEPATPARTPGTPSEAYAQPAE